MGDQTTHSTPRSCFLVARSGGARSYEEPRRTAERRTSVKSMSPTSSLQATVNVWSPAGSTPVTSVTPDIACSWLPSVCWESEPSSVGEVNAAPLWLIRQRPRTEVPAASSLCHWPPAVTSTRPARGIGRITETQLVYVTPGSQMPDRAERPIVRASGAIPPTVSAFAALVALLALVALVASVALVALTAVVAWAALSAAAALGTLPRLDSSMSAPLRVSARTSLPRRSLLRTSLLLIELSTMAALPIVAAA